MARGNLGTFYRKILPGYLCRVGKFYRRSNLVRFCLCVVSVFNSLILNVLCVGVWGWHAVSDSQHVMNTSAHTQLIRPTVSFIIPAMNEEATLQELFEGIQANVALLSRGWEIIFIDDGSSDGTWAEMSRLAAENPGRVRAMRFRRNRGKADALALGYESAEGEIVFTMDADLQDDPNEIPRFIEKLHQGYDIVSGWKRRRHDPWHKVLPSRLFNAVLSKLVNVPLHDHNCGFKCYRRDVVKALPMYGDMHRMVPSLASFEGFRTAEIPVQHHARKHGVSKYGWKRLFTGFFDTATVSLMQRWREKPMQLIGLVSLCLGLAGVSFSLVAVWMFILGATPAMGFFICSAMFLCTSLLGMLQGFAMEHRVYYSKLDKAAPQPIEQLGGVSFSDGHFNGPARQLVSGM
jgi:glycosyltransferase involved in cell wall biosynthesis